MADTLAGQKAARLVVTKDSTKVACWASARVGELAAGRAASLAVSSAVMKADK